MKKLIFIALMMQTISCLFADSGCRARDWRWGSKAPEHTLCYCPCQQYPHERENRNKCMQCGHYREPIEYKINACKKKQTVDEKNGQAQHHKKHHHRRNYRQEKSEHDSEK